MEIIYISSKFNSSDKINIIQLYQTGKSIKEVAIQFKCALMTIYLILKESNAVRTVSDSLKITGIKKRIKYSNEIIKLFNEGKSVQAISNILKIQRRTINKTLYENGIKHRNRSESMYNRMKHTSVEERCLLTKKANLTIKGTHPIHTEKTIHAMACGRFKNLSTIGTGETQFKEWIDKFGYGNIPQFPIGHYNIDIMIGNLAVEIHNCTTNPIKLPKIKKRIKYLLNSGFHVIYIWITPKKRRFLTISAAIYTVSILKFIESTPSIDSKYWVIRGSGEFVSSGSSDFN